MCKDDVYNTHADILTNTTLISLAFCSPTMLDAFAQL